MRTGTRSGSTSRVPCYRDRGDRRPVLGAERLAERPIPQLHTICAPLTVSSPAPDTAYKKAAAAPAAPPNASETISGPFAGRGNGG